MTTVPSEAVARVLATARKYIGQQEQPPGSHSNSGPFVQACQAFTFLRGTHWPWCIAFVQRCFAEAGVAFPYRTAGAYDFLRWAKRVGWTIPAPRPGAVAIWNIGSGHGSIVESYDPKTGVVTTIDGNVSDQVMRCHRKVSLAAGFIWHPALSKKSPVVPAHKTKPPRLLTVSSLRGHKKLFVQLRGERYAPGITIRKGR